MPSEQGAVKRLKNTASRRRLPIHPKVIEAGFLRYVKRIEGQGAERLFPDLQPDRFGKLSAGFSKAFMKYLRKELGINDDRKVFHSFRVTVHSRPLLPQPGLSELLFLLAGRLSRLGSAGVLHRRQQVG